MTIPRPWRILLAARNGQCLAVTTRSNVSQVQRIKVRDICTSVPRWITHLERSTSNPKSPKGINHTWFMGFYLRASAIIRLKLSNPFWILPQQYAHKRSSNTLTNGRKIRPDYIWERPIWLARLLYAMDNREHMLLHVGGLVAVRNSWSKDTRYHYANFNVVYVSLLPCPDTSHQCWRRVLFNTDNQNSFNHFVLPSLTANVDKITSAAIWTSAHENAWAPSESGC